MFSYCSFLEAGVLMGFQDRRRWLFELKRPLLIDSFKNSNDPFSYDVSSERRDLMSANPEAFEFLRREAYAFVNKNGKDSQDALLKHCEAVLADKVERDGIDLSLASQKALCRSVTGWVLRRYQPKKRKPKTTRESRAAKAQMVVVEHEMLLEIGTKSTIRDGTSVAGQSKSTVGRHFMAYGISPRRDKLIEKLPAKVRQLARILDTTFPKEGAGLVLLDDLGIALYDGFQIDPSGQTPTHAKSTLSTRRKRLKKYIQTISDAGIGYSLLVQKDVVAVRRGRRFRSYKDAAVWIEDERHSRGVRRVHLPMNQSGAFWEDRWVKNILDVYILLINPHINSASWLVPLIDLLNLMGEMVSDPTPVYKCVNAAIEFPGIDDLDLPSRIQKYADNVFDKEAGDAVHRVGTFLSNASLSAQTAETPEHVFDDLELILPFHKVLREHVPDSYARYAYVRDIISGDVEEPDEFWMHCDSLRKLEKAGQWTPPPLQELSDRLEDM